MLTAREFIQATLEDSDSARSFRKDVALVRESWNKLKPNRLELTAHHMYAALLEMDDSARGEYVMCTHTAPTSLLLMM